MQNMFKIVSDQSPIQLEMSSEELELAIEIGTYIDQNFTASDFFTVQNTSQATLSAFVCSLKDTQASIPPDSTPLSLTLTKEQYQIFTSLFLHADTFLDEVPEFEKRIGTIEKIADIVVPPPALAG